MNENEDPTRGTRQIIMFLGITQLCAGGVFVASWAWIGKAPGAFVGGLLTLLVAKLFSKGFLGPKIAHVVAVILTVLGLSYPWPWVQYTTETVTVDATWRDATAPRGCQCLEVIVTHPQLIDEGFPSKAWRFCDFDMQPVRKQLSPTGTISSTWSTRTAHSLLGNSWPAGAGAQNIGPVPWSKLGGNAKCYRHVETDSQ